MCHVCPLNGQRKVGTDGDPNSEHILIGEAPGADEEAYMQGRAPHGRPFVGKSGYFFKVGPLAKAELAQVAYDPGKKWGRVTRLNAFVMNVIMCRPPGNKIESPQGRKAVLCCANSARLLLQKLLAQNPARTISSVGVVSTALCVGRPKVAINEWRGRVVPLTDWKMQLATVTPALIAKKVLSGIKADEWPRRWGCTKEEWKAQERILRKILAANRVSLRKCLKAKTKLNGPNSMTTTPRRRRSTRTKTAPVAPASATSTSSTG